MQLNSGGILVLNLNNQSICYELQLEFSCIALCVRYMESLLIDTQSFATIMYTHMHL